MKNMRRTYIIPIISVEYAIEESDMLEASQPPNVETGNAAGDSGNGGDGPSYGGDGDGGDMSKHGLYNWGFDDE